MQRASGWTAEMDAFVIANFGRMGMSDIAERLGYSVAAVYLRLPHLGLAARARKADVLWSPDEIAALREVYGQQPLKELPGMFPGKSTEDLRTKAKSLGLVSRKARRKATFKEDFFSELTLRTCYWAGFIAADGYVNDDRGYVSLNIQERDCDHLMAFCRDVGFWSPPAHIETKAKQRSIMGRRCRAGNMARVTVFSRRWLRDLDETYNIRPGKTYNLRPPNLAEGRQCLAYVAGLLDGDGFITLDNKPIIRLRTGIVGLQVMTDWVKTVVDAFLQGSGMESSRPPRFAQRGPLYDWRLSGRRAYRLLHELRSLDLPSLPRKWCKVTEYELMKEMPHAAR